MQIAVANEMNKEETHEMNKEKTHEMNKEGTHEMNKEEMMKTAVMTGRKWTRFHSTRSSSLPSSRTSCNRQVAGDNTSHTFTHLQPASVRR